MLDRLEDEHDNLRCGAGPPHDLGRHRRARPTSCSRCGGSGTCAATSSEGRDRVGPRARDAAMDRRSPRGRGCARSRRPAGWRTGAATWSPPARTTAPRSRWRARWATTPRSRTPLYNLFFARRPASDSGGVRSTSCAPTTRRCWTRRWRSGRGSATSRAWARRCGGSASGTGIAASSRRAEETATRALEIFERIGDAFWVSWSRFTRAFGRTHGRRPAEGAARDLVPTLREFWAAATSPASPSSLPASRRRCCWCDRRDRRPTRSAAPTNRLVAETGLHLATLWPADEIPIVDPDTADPELARRPRAWGRMVARRGGGADDRARRGDRGQAQEAPSGRS